ncbi:MAG: pyrroline-5-carboxylate reductase [Candidatus Omnitrophota bacterium]|jgi:pyrroline-5-carboxylate reductase
MSICKKRVGIIGYGNMGSAIAEGIKTDYRVTVFDKDTARTAAVSGIKAAQGTEALLTESEIVVLAVKPQELGELLALLQGKTGGKLLISIAAGIPTALLEERLGRESRVVRAMPNLPAKIGKGMICYCAGIGATGQDMRDAAGIFSFIGRTMPVEEEMMDAVTAVSGSGPGYFYFLLEQIDSGKWEDLSAGHFVPELAKAAQTVGFSPEDAELLASVTAEGSMALLKSAGVSPEVLRGQVTSKGGTTEAGIKAMIEAGNSLSEAVKAALKRARELSGA